MSGIEIRQATSDDAERILAFVKELAVYERAEREVTATVEDIRKSLFHNNATTNCVIGSIDNVEVGFAVYFFNYSTWLGRHGLYLEDLYVTPEFRNAGVGKALLKHLAKVAISHNCGRFEWSVLDWNEPAIRFYEGIGAEAQDDWVTYRLAGSALERFAGS